MDEQKKNGFYASINLEEYANQILINFVLKLTSFDQPLYLNNYLL